VVLNDSVKAVARRLRVMPVLLKDAAMHTAASLVPDSLLTLGAYRAEPVRDWENEYKGGRWSYMEGVQEVARYSVIVGYYGCFKPGGTILDVGCGEGILQQKLAALRYRRYLGIDISANAIAKASTHADYRTEFRHTDAQTFVADQKFDAIIFNEVLYYFSDPVGIVRRLADSLEPNGIMIASIWTSPLGRRRALQIWRLIDSIAEIIDSTTAANREVWTIKVFQPKAALPTAKTPSPLGAPMQPARVPVYRDRMSNQLTTRSK
jgi:2-polyprenyl-3-methyl-5-hydroxy-6-metoxy-1,4-benzoquinol methylase